MSKLVLTLVVWSSVGWAQVLSSPCFKEQPIAALEKVVRLATVNLEARWFLNPTGDAGFVLTEGPPLVVCVELQRSAEPRVRVIYTRHNVSVLYWVEPQSLVGVPLTAESWAASRHRLRPDDESGETGCQKKFRPGTLLYDGPDGTVIGVVTDGWVYLGRWDVVDTKTGQWSQTRARAKPGAWVKGKPVPDWCPE